MITKLSNILLIGMLLAIVIVGILSLTDGGIIDNREAVRPEFEQRRAQWEAQDINSYRALILREDGHVTCASSAEVKVINGRVVNYRPSPLESGLLSESQCASMIYRSMSVDHVFEDIAQFLNGASYADRRIRFEIEYDEIYGFPSKVRFHSNLPHMPYYEINNFEALP